MYTDAITNLGNFTCSGVHRTEAARVAGRTVASVDTAFSFFASVQPAMGKDLKRLPQGRDAEDLIVIYTKSVLTIGGPGTGKLPDLVSVDGSTYELQHVEHWKAFGSEYYKAIGLAVT